MDLITAVVIVNADQRESYDFADVASAIEHALNTVSLADLNDDAETFSAYSVVLTVRPSFCPTCGEMESQTAMTRDADRWCSNGCGYDYADVDAAAAQAIRDAHSR